LVYNNPSRNYLMEVQVGMLEACQAHHYNLFLAPIGVGRERRQDMDDMFRNFGPDGVVLIPPLTDDKVLLELLEEKEVPYSCIAPKTQAGRIGVAMDETAAVLEMMARLIELGHRRIGHIKGPVKHGASQWRFNGYREALALAGIEYEPELVVQGAFSFESGCEGANALLDLRRPPTAIFAANDDMAAGVIRVAGERGLAVPRDLSVCGFDDTPISRHIYPALTTIRQPTSEMGRWQRSNCSRASALRTQEPCCASITPCSCASPRRRHRTTHRMHRNDRHPKRRRRLAHVASNL